MLNVKKLPVPLLPTMVGACTLSNVYSGEGFPFIRDFFMILSTVILVIYSLKILNNLTHCKDEYEKIVPCSLYAGFFMLMMILSSYYFKWFPNFSKYIWFTAIICHAVHILLFTYKVIKTCTVDSFLPCFFVTYNGIMVSVVIGKIMNEPIISRIITYYGIGIFTLLLPFMVYRLIKYPVAEGVYHTQAILLAPSSLCVVCYIGSFQNPNPYILGYLYISVILTLLFIVYKLPKFFEIPFSPAYAGITFPMAIGIVATLKMSNFLSSSMPVLSGYLKQLAGIQIYMTTGIIFYVLLKLFSWLKKEVFE